MPVPTHAELLARAAALVPALRARADDCERQRCCPAETVADFQANGLLRITQPARYGGYALGWDIRSEVGEVLARGCGSQAWIQHILTDHTQKLGAFAVRAQDEVWGDAPDTRIAAGLDPVGLARRVAGGVIYSGRHGFSSGIDHARWLLCGGHILADGAAPQRCFFLLPKSDAQVIDDWHVMGLAGTGSKSFTVDGVFVPEHRILDAGIADEGTGPGAAAHGAAIFKVPFTTIAATGFAAIGVGIARGLLADWVAYTGGRRSRGNAVAELMGTHMTLGAAAAQIEAARRMYLGAAEDAMATLVGGGRLGPRQRLGARLAASFAIRLAHDAVHRLYTAAGGRALYQTNVMQRQMRDLQACASHISVTWDTATSGYGAHLLAGADAPAL